ncbi:MAG: hypothetical protein PVG39_04995 [Desulfobacteraceae bacterium]
MEIPDIKQLIENPSLSYIKNALSGLSGNENDDSCIDINKSSQEFLQAIGCRTEGFVLRFKEQSGSKVYQYQQISIMRTPIF